MFWEKKIKPTTKGENKKTAKSKTNSLNIVMLMQKKIQLMKKVSFTIHYK